MFYSQGCDLFRKCVEPLAKQDDRIAEAVAVAKRCDTVILVLGLDETLEGEEGDTGNSYNSGDKEDLLLPAPQRRLLQKVLEVGKPTVVVLMAGSSIDIREAEEKTDAILLSWYPGALGGRAVADLIFGKESPSGKLPVTFYTNNALEEMPAFTDYSMRGRTYRYYQGTPLYPFGYGLTYGKCRIQDLKADSGTAYVRVKNEGEFETDEVIELYLHDEGSPYAPPNPVLCGFKRIRLRGKEEGEYSLTIDPDAFTVVNERGERIAGSGNWKLFAGFGAPDKRTEELTGRKAVSAVVTG